MYKNNDNIDWNEYYTILGEFVVNFENIVFDIREDSSFILKNKGLMDPMLGGIIFGQKFFTAEPLVSCYVSMVNHIIQYKAGKEELIKRLNNFKNRFTKLIECRNDILHSTHFWVEDIVIIGPPESQKKPDFRAIKPTPKKTGYDSKKTARHEIIEYIAQLTQLRKELKEFIHDLHNFINTRKLTSPNRGVK